MKNLKKLFIIFLGINLFCASYILKDATGRANATGAPGETTCAGGGCHNGGSSATKGVTISATPSFSNGDYYPDSIYTVSVTIGAVGFSKFGFGCEVLTTSNVNSGTLQLPGSGAKIISSTRKNVTHNTPKSGTNQAIFTFGWKAPSQGTGKTTIYVCGNAVNGNGSTSGDLPIPASLSLTEAVVTSTVDTTNTSGLKENIRNILCDIMVYPQPARGLSHISYSLKDNALVKIQLCDLNGKSVKTILEEVRPAGNQSQVLDLTQVSAGVYFLKVFSGNNLSGQKLFIVN